MVHRCVVDNATKVFPTSLWLQFCFQTCRMFSISTAYRKLPCPFDGDFRASRAHLSGVFARYVRPVLRGRQQELQFAQGNVITHEVGPPCAETC